jgi:Zn-finger nucleic acid-binding protein
MQMHALPGNHGKPVELDLCFHCQGMWIDSQENLKLSAAAVADLFRLLHEQRRDGACAFADPTQD